MRQIYQLRSALFIILSLSLLNCFYSASALDISGFPRRIEGYSAKSIACGGYHTAVLTDSGEVHHWGYISEAHPEQVLFPEGVVPVSVACGHSECFAISDSGDVYRWGGSNQPRDPTTKLLLQAQATKVSFPERIKKLSVGFGHAVFVSDTGVVYVLGSGTRGQLGLGDETTEVVDPHNLPPLSNALVVDACAGGHHTLLLDETGKLFSFGSNDYGQLGDGTKIQSSLPKLVQLPDGAHAKAISCGGDHNLILMEDKSVMSFGWGERGQLGTGSTQDKLLPTHVSLPANFTVASLAAGAYGHSVLLSTEGEVATFGWCEDGQCGHLGLKEDILLPHKVSTLQNITAICGGYKHTVVIRGGTKLLAFGDSFFGQLGQVRSAVATDFGSLDDDVPDPDVPSETEKPITFIADHGENDGERLVEEQKKPEEILRLA